MQTPTGHGRKKDENPVGYALQPIRTGFVAIGFVSLLINLLMLTGPLFMLQVYDRVLASGSVPTLIVIGGLVIALYAFFGILETLRGRILSRLGQRVDARLSSLAYRISSLLPVRLGRGGTRLRPVADLDIVRQFLSGQGPAVIFDMPWMPLYLAIVFMFHPLLGMVAAGGGLVIIILIGLNEALARGPVAESSAEASRRASDVESGRENSEAICAMGMEQALADRWEARNDAYLATQRKTTDRMGLFGSMIKTIRFILQSAILAVGAWLAIEQEITPGVMIAASIMTSRALAPIEQAVSHWRGFVACRQALKRLRAVFSETNLVAGNVMLDLPLPKQSLIIENVSCGPFGEAKPVVTNLKFELVAGDGLGVIGPSGSGKSTLARALVGAVPPLRGAVRYDGAEIGQWPPERRGAFIGYLPQDLQLFDGTIAENIARFRPDASSEAVIEAAKLANVHDLIVGMPEGYNTVIGRDGRGLSAGQRQRIGLARALYGNPFLVVLDEPNSNLDAEGEAAVVNAVQAMRDKNCIVIVIAHRPSAIASVDKILCMRDGQMAAFGPKDEVLKKVLQPVRKQQAGA